MGDEPKSYAAFLSYSHADEAFARKLHRALETYRVPRGVHATRRLRPVFRDRDELRASPDLSAAIRRALGASRALVVVCSPRAAQSKWVDAEIREFLSLGRTDRVFGVIPEDGGAEAGRSGPDEGPMGGESVVATGPRFPPALGTEPIAADARRGADGFRGAVRKLVAGILDVELDALVRRDRQRRRRAQAAGAILLACLAVGAVVGWRQVDRLVDTTGRDAVARTKSAEAARHGSTEARDAALRGDPLAVQEAIRPTREVEPERWDAALLEHVAKRRLVGLAQPPIDVGDVVAGLELLPGGRHALVRGERSQQEWLLTWPGGARVRRLDPSPGADGVEVRPSPDGRRLLLLDSARVRVQDVATGVERPIEAPAGSRAAWLGDGQVLVATQADRRAGELRVVSLAEGGGVRRFTLGSGTPGDVFGARDGTSGLVWWWKQDAAGGGETAMATWFDATGQVLAELPREADSTGGGIDPTGARLLTPMEAGCDLRDRRGQGWTFPGEKGLTRATWSGGGGYCVLESGGRLTVREAATGKDLWSAVVSAWGTDPGDRWFAETDDLGTVRVRALATGEPVAEFRDQIGWPGPGDFPHDDGIRFSADGETLVLSGAGSRVKLWRWKEVRPDQRTFPPRGRQKLVHATLAGARRLALVDERPRLTYVDLDSGAVEDLDADVGSEEGVWCMAGSEEGIALGTKAPVGEPVVSVRDARTGALRGTLALDRVVLEGPSATLVQNPRYVRVLASGKHVVTVGLDTGRAAFWRASDLAPLGSARLAPPSPTIEPPDAPGKSPVALSASGEVLAVAALDGNVTVVSVPEGRALATLRPLDEGPVWVALSPDGRHLVSGDRAHLLLWDVATGRSQTLLGEADAAANEAAFTGDVLAVACSDRVVRVWKTATGAPVRSLEQARLAGDDTGNLGAWVDTSDEHTKAGFVALRADPLGRFVAALADTGALCLWNLATGEQVLRWRVPPDRYARLLLTEAGERLVVVGSDAAVTCIDLR